jgi:hypothetical protein
VFYQACARPGVPELERLGRTITAWETQLLAYFTTGRVSSGPTEAVNLLVKRIKRVGFGFRNFEPPRLSWRLPSLGKDGAMSTAPRKYPDELRERAVRMVFEVREQSGERRGSIVRVARQLGVGAETLRNWGVPRTREVALR